MPIKFPYQRTTTIHTAEDIKSWDVVTLANDESVTAELRGKTFYVSPAFGKAGKERHHHRIEAVVEQVGGDVAQTIAIHMGHAPSATHLDRVYSTYYYTIDFSRVAPGQFTREYASPYNSRCFNWWLVEVNPNVEVKEIKHTYWQCPDETTTSWMHTMPIQTINYDGGRMHYAISYPPNYDSESGIKYPVVFSTAGSDTLGDDKKFLTMVNPSCVITKYYEQYTQYPCIHVSFQVPYNHDFPTPPPAPDRAYPYHSSWSTHYDSRSYGAVGVRKLLQQLIDDPDHCVDENRIYVTGMSGGGIFSFEALKGLRDILAAAAPISGWAIGGAYQEVQAHQYWETLYYGNDSMRDRLRKEVLRGKHIPTLVGVGSKDNMKYGSKAFKDMADEVGAVCKYVEIPGASHGGAVGSIFSKTENFAWLLSHTKVENVPDDPFPSLDNQYAECYKPAFDLELAAKGVPEEITTVIDYAYESAEKMSKGDLDMDGDIDNADIGKIMGNFTGAKIPSSSSSSVIDYSFDPVLSELVTYGVSQTTINCYSKVFYRAERAALGDLDADGDVDNSDLGSAIGNFTGSKKK